MGNKQSDDFSQNPHFNINQHQQAMRNLQANYADSGYQVHGGNPRQNVKVTETQFKSVHRTASIYKPSIDLHPSPNILKLNFEYQSDKGSKLQVYIGVLKVDQDQSSKLTINIKSQLFYQEMLQTGKRVKFMKEYPLNGFSKLNGCNVVLRIMSLNTDQRTQYSITNTGKAGWKVLLQKFQINGAVTQLHNIYKGGSQGQDCIICFSEPVNTLIIPCNHLCLCFECCQHVRKSTNSCPICRSIIQGFKKIKST